MEDFFSKFPLEVFDVEGVFSEFPLRGLVFPADFLGDFLLGMTIESVKSPPSSISSLVSSGCGFKGDLVTGTFSIISFNFFAGGVEVEWEHYMHVCVLVCMCVCMCV